MNEAFSSAKSRSAKISHAVEGDRTSLRGDREPVLIVVIGSRHGITCIIHSLLRLGFAQMHEWSKPQIDPQSGKLMQIMTKYISPD